MKILISLSDYFVCDLFSSAEKKCIVGGMGGLLIYSVDNFFIKLVFY